MFDGFGGRDEVVRSFEYQRVWREVRIVGFCGKALLLEHHGKRGTGTRANIDAVGTGRKLSDQRRGQTVEKMAIT